MSVLFAHTPAFGAILYVHTCRLSNVLWLTDPEGALEGFAVFLHLVSAPS